MQVLLLILRENKMWKILLINVPSAAAADYLGLFRAFRLVCCIIRFLGQSHIWSRTCHRRLNFKCQGKCQQIWLIFHAEFRGGGATELLTEHFKHFFNWWNFPRLLDGSVLYLLLLLILKSNEKKYWNSISANTYLFSIT